MNTSPMKTTQMIINTVSGADDFSESRIGLLAAVLDRRMSYYGLTPDSDGEKRVILAVAADALPPAYPPTRDEIAFARIMRQASAHPSCYLAH